MIRNFWVRNFLSIRDKQELDFTATARDSVLISEVADGVFLYKLGILYGSNASGKSNMLIALEEVFKLLVFAKSDASEKIRGAIPFALTKEEPIEMHVSFYAAGIRYDYDVKFNSSKILSEVLYFYPNGSRALFYSRSFVGDNVQADIKFGQKLGLLQKTQDSIREYTLNNHSVLSVCSKAALKEDIVPFYNLHAWIIKNYHDVDGDNKRGIVDILKDAAKDEKKRSFFRAMLQKADLNILDYKMVLEDRRISNELLEALLKASLSEQVRDDFLSPTYDSVSFVNYSKEGNFDIPLVRQSKGTMKYIRILDALYDMVCSSHVYYLDELGEDLHNDLLFYYLNVFLFNSDKSQLLITSQETTLLSQDLINENRGVVWFVEKNKETASSEYNRGDSFGLHKNLSLYHSYRIGRLGAKPELGSIFINMDD